ncbi:hypothetical protein K503DRAFT_725736 [Rhizopogon vinicolor AM-OR11-026]|uniref:Heterokaryon incompatibility domain-containing protein n=1 Tax=Rhizopogon vinicolor AM-OR11-026 TaxID=1314800 RepID=A0A1B7MLR4_9AGAM|nr:hypothetical protein K503DRAFT_725736 [Rhizopogon vinicolor AM-OR11-026]
MNNCLPSTKISLDTTSPTFQIKISNVIVQDLPRLGIRQLSLRKNSGIYIEFAVGDIIKTKRFGKDDTSSCDQELTFDARETSMLAIHAYAKRLLGSDKFIGTFEGGIQALLLQSESETINCPLTLSSTDCKTQSRRATVSFHLSGNQVTSFSGSSKVLFAGLDDMNSSDTRNAASPIVGTPKPIVVDVKAVVDNEQAARPCIPDVLDICGEYIYNEVPTHLLYIPERRIISRDQLKQIYRAQMESITEEDIEGSLALLHREPWRVQDPISGTRNLIDPQRRDAIRDLVINKLHYAIFSHRWLAEEPTFQDMSRDQKPTGPGYDKLMKFLDKAAELGYKLAWSDTCCIDKTSSAELDEAIRAMFRWYRGSRVCIAYLGDSSSVADFPREVWFTRGWTLQELLAPWVIKFYGRDWVPIGDVGMENDKDNPEMLKVLSEVTTIPESQLLGFTPGVRDVHMKMKWASTRRTTRIEDNAYCLLGIFNLSIPVSYGEGRWAFHRLMETLIQRCNEWQIFAWIGPCSPYNDVIPVSPRCYGGNTQGIDGINSQQCPPVGDKSFRLEQPGMKLKIFLVKIAAVEFVCPDQWRGEAMLRPDTLSLTVDKPVRILHHFPLDIFRGLSHQLVIGILNFENVDGNGETVDAEGQLYESRQYLALLLQHGFVNGLGKTATKHMTEDSVVVQCSEDMRRALTTVYI